MLIDMHAHTVEGGSTDSNLLLRELVVEAKRVGLDGICLTEHGGGWDEKRFEEMTHEYDILIIRALEVDTELGHVGTFGLDGYISGIHKVEELRHAVDQAGGFLIAHHPFRGFFDRANLLWTDKDSRPTTPQEAAQHLLFQMVDAIEALNGGNNDRENTFALEVARELGLPCTGASDCHSLNGIGCHATFFEADLSSEEEFLKELRAGRFYPVTGLRKDTLVPYKP